MNIKSKGAAAIFLENILKDIPPQSHWTYLRGMILSTGNIFLREVALDRYISEIVRDRGESA